LPAQASGLVGRLGGAVVVVVVILMMLVVMMMVVMNEAIETLARIIANLPENKHAHAALQPLKLHQIPTQPLSPLRR
jgi:hypothetical protein